jgi:hypothetical protein
LPAQLGDRAPNLPVSALVAIEFGLPIIGMRLWQAAAALAAMLMPEAAVHKNHFAETRKDQVRAARQRSNMQAIV